MFWWDMQPTTTPIMKCLLSPTSYKCFKDWESVSFVVSFLCGQCLIGGGHSAKIS